jgi:PAS domain S-box-containing protein
MKHPQFNTSNVPKTNSTLDFLYRNFFEFHPSPAWVYDLESLKFLLVNNAAVQLYGYSEKEFLTLTLKDIRPKEDVPLLLKNISESKENTQESGLWKHKKKNGEIIFVKVNSQKTEFNGRNARFVVVTDLTDKVKNKKAITQETAKLKSIIESTSDLVFSVDTNYCYTSFNAAHKSQIKKLLNVDIKIGDSFFSALSAIEMIKAKINFDKTLYGVHLRKIVDSTDESNQKHYFDVTHNPIRDEEGKIIGISVFAKDITEYKFYYEKFKQLSQAVEQSPVTIIITDIDGNIEYINSKGTDITGYSEDEIVGQNPRIFSTGKKSSEEYQQMWNTIKSGKIWKGEFHNKKKNGELYWESATISPIQDENGETIKFLAVKEDITERKRVEDELIAAKLKAEETNRIKNAFLSNMSHEIRTPLVGILGFADILENELDDVELKSMATSIINGGKRLMNTLTSLLSLTELESIKENIELDEIDVNQLCNDIFSSFKNHTSSQSVQFNISLSNEPLKLNINNRLLRESLYQLIKNAETFTNSGYITLKSYKKAMPSSGSEFGVIEISDTGIGIPEDKLKVVFEEFRQVSEGLGRSYEGTGLGLTLTKKYIELMGGKIELESNVDEGTKVSLVFPINEKILDNETNDTSSDKKNDINVTNTEKNNLTILIVENEDINRIFIEKCVNKIGKFHSVTNGLDAISSASKQNYDLILMDINLGSGIDGVQTAQELRKISGYKNTPIVAMTAYVDPESVENFLSNGFSHYIAKPFLIFELHKLINKITTEKYYPKKILRVL